jgi:enamine deaminase RidA (YjgF/YER057c/UK114 family)
MPKRIITSPKLLPPRLPFAPATLAGGFLFACCVGTDAEGKFAIGDARAQTRQCLANIQALVEAAGGTMRDIVKCTIYVVGRENWGPMNEVFFEPFAEEPPHRVSCLVVGLGSPDCLVEIDATAYIEGRD